MPKIKSYGIAGGIQLIGVQSEIQRFPILEFRIEVAFALGRQFSFLEINTPVPYRRQIIESVDGGSFLSVKAALLFPGEMIVIPVLSDD